MRASPGRLSHQAADTTTTHEEEAGLESLLLSVSTLLRFSLHLFLALLRFALLLVFLLFLLVLFLVRVGVGVALLNNVILLIPLFNVLFLGLFSLSILGQSSNALACNVSSLKILEDPLSIASTALSRKAISRCF